jgi:hypothetical protein
MSTQPPPSGQDPFDPRFPERLSPGFVPPQDFPRYPHPPSHPAGSHPAHAAAEDPLVPADFGGWAERVLGVVRRSLIPLVLIQAVVAVISLVYQLISKDSVAALGPTAQPETMTPEQLSSVFGELFVGLAVLSVVGMFAAAASVHIAIHDAVGAPTSISAALGYAGGRMPALIGWALVWWVLLSVGFVLFLVPAIYLMIVFSASFLGVVVVERGPITRSFILVNQRFLATAGRMLLAMLVGALYFGLTLALNNAFGPASVVGAIVGAALSIPFSLAMLGVSVVTYAELRHHENPEIGTTQLAAELNR